MTGGSRSMSQFNNYDFKITDPFMDNDTMKHLINVYADYGENLESFQENIAYENVNNTKGWSGKDYNDFYVFVFNKWKHSITDMSDEKKFQLRYNGKLGFDFDLVQKQLNNVDDVRNIKEIEEFLRNYGSREPIASYWYTRDNKHSNWNHFSSQTINFDTEENKLEHNLYMNIDSQGLHKFSKLFIEKCEEKNLPYHFVISNSDYNRNDSFIIYSSRNHVVDYFNVVSEILKENKDLTSYVGYRSPLTKRFVLPYIGYGNEDNFWNEPSYCKNQAKLVYEALEYNLQYLLLKNPNLKLKVDGQNETILEAIADKVVDDKVDYLELLSRTDLNQYFGLKPRQVKSSRFQDYLSNAIEESLEEGVQKQSMDFKPVHFKYSRKKKNQSKFLEVSTSELQKAAKSILPKVADTYSNFIDNVRKVISGIRKQNKQQQVSDFKKSTKSYDTPLLTCNHLYHLTKEQIIQDLPLYSTEASRYTGAMSAEEIKLSQEKIKVLTKR